MTLTVVPKSDAELPSAEAAFVHVKDNESMPKSEVIKVWAYLTPTKTYLAGRYQFGHFDGTSIFNFVKGLVHVYFGGEPYKNVQGGAMLPAKAEPIVTLDERWRRKSSACSPRSSRLGIHRRRLHEGHPSKLPPPLRGLPPQHARCAPSTPSTKRGSRT